MSDILSTYYKSHYTLKDSIYSKKKIFTPNRITKIPPDETFKNLSQYGFKLTENNLILMSRKKLLPNLTIYNTRNFQQKESLTQTQHIGETKEKNQNQNQNLSNTFQKSSEDTNSLINKKGQKTDYINNIKKIRKSKDYLKLKDELSDFNDIKNSNIELNDSEDKKKKIHKPYKTKLFSNKYLLYKEDSKEIVDNSKKAEQITNELLSLTNSRDIKNYYIKKDLEKFKKHELNKNHEIPVVDPMSYIRYNLVTNPKKKDLFKSFDVQLTIMGSEKYRNNLIDGVNEYKNHVAKFGELRGPTGFDKNQEEEIKRKNLIKQMNNNFKEKRGMIFTHQTFRTKNKINKNMFNFEYDEEYKKLKKLMNKGIDKYERNMNKKRSKKNIFSVDKKDIKMMNKLDNEAEYLIKGTGDIVKFSNRFLSFDEKLNKLVSKTINTTGYLFKRTKEYQKIKTKIDQFYNIDEN